MGSFIWNSCQFSQRLQIKCGWSKGTAHCLCCILIAVHSNIAAPRTWRGCTKKAINNACAEMLFVSPWYLTGLWWCPRWWEEKQSLTWLSSPCGSVTCWHHWWEQTCSLHFGYSQQNRHGALQKKSTLFHSVLYSTFLQVGILQPISGRSLLNSVISDQAVVSKKSTELESLSIRGFFYVVSLWCFRTRWRKTAVLCGGLYGQTSHIINIIGPIVWLQVNREIRSACVICFYWYFYFSLSSL